MLNNDANSSNSGSNDDDDHVDDNDYHNDNDHQQHHQRPDAGYIVFLALHFKFSQTHISIL